MQIDKEGIEKIKSIGEEEIRFWVIQALVHKNIFEESLMQTTPNVKEIESQISKHDVVARLLEPVDYLVIMEEAHAWIFFIKKPIGHT